MWYGGRETSVIESCKHQSYNKQCNQAFSVCGIFSWRAENLLESDSPRPGFLRDFSNGLWESFIFLLFPQIMNIIKGKIGESISTIIIVAPVVAIMKPGSSNLNNSSNSLKLGAGGRHGWRHGYVEGRCACEIIYGNPERQKKSHLKGYLATIKRLML